MADIKEALAEMTKKLKQVAPVFCDIFVERVKGRTPVITGTLRDAWKVEPAGNTINIVNDANRDGNHYASFVEYGTYKMAPRGMLRATLLERDQILAEAVKKVGL